jgi:hypothetical protein
MRRRTIITVGSGDAEVKIYTLRREDGYSSFQAVWYELRQRKSKTFAKMEAAKLWAQQVSSSCRHELPDNGPPHSATLRFCGRATHGRNATD